jgi:hypothetical protein
MAGRQGGVAKVLLQRGMDDDAVHVTAGTVRIHGQPGG